MANIMSRITLANTAVSNLADLARISGMTDLKEKYQHYSRRLKDAQSARKLTNEELAARLDAHAVTVSKLRSGTIPLDDEWRARIAEAMNMDMEVLFGYGPMPDPQPSEIFKPTKKRGRKPANDNTTLIVLGFAAGAQFGHRNGDYQAHEYVPRPPGLNDVSDAYALRTRNDSMAPRYMPDEILYVNPEQSIKPGDHVIIHAQLDKNSEPETWVKRFDAITDDDVVVSQYNPPIQMRFKRQYVKYIHRVLPPNEYFLTR